MIHKERLAEFERRVSSAVQGMIGALQAFLSPLWPPWDVNDGGFWNEEDYERGGNTGNGPGLSRHVTGFELYEEWQAGYQDAAQNWLFFDRQSLFNTISEIASPDNFFEEFGRAESAPYDRDQWRAGSVDADILFSIVQRFIEKTNGVLTAIDPLLVPDGLGDYSNLAMSHLWSWETYTGAPETTLEVLAGRFAWDDDAAAYCPHVPILPDKIWDGFAAEEKWRHDTAKKLIESIQWLERDGVERLVGDEISDAVRVWQTGSQTRRRGP